MLLLLTASSHPSSHLLTHITCSLNSLSYLNKNLQPLQPVTVVLEEVLQFPDVLQQVGLFGGLAQALQSGALRHLGDVLHQNLLLVRRNLGTRDWGKERGGTSVRRVYEGSLCSRKSHLKKQNMVETFTYFAFKSKM